MGQTRDRARLLRLLAEHPLAKIADLGKRRLQFALQAVLASSGLLEFEPVTLVDQFKPLNSPSVQRLVLLGLHHQLDMLALGQRDLFKVEWLG
ncbi:MAG: hypothetical protein IPP44_12810 [Ideonella sp.]|nr:hypothetical protein [Ideonella sp.]